MANAKKNKETALDEAAAIVKTADPGAITVYDFGDDSGAGVDELGAAGISTPWFDVLQSNSPEVEANVDGAKAGLIVNRTEKSFLKSMVIQPVYIKREFVLWREREKGGGVVARYDEAHPDVRAAVARNDGSEIWTKDKPLKIGEHNLFDTRYLYFHILDEEGDGIEGAGIMGCKSSKIKPVKDLASVVKWAKGRPPLYSTRFKLDTWQDKQKSTGKLFWNIRFAPLIGKTVLESVCPPDSFLYQQGKAFYEAAKLGAVKTDFGAEGSAQEDEDVSEKRHF